MSRNRLKAMPRKHAGVILASRPRLASLLAALVALPVLAAADDLAPILSPDRIEDAPSTRADPYPTFDNFAWRAFIALNWPSLPRQSRRARSRQNLGDPGPRVWETFKSRYELFRSVPNGSPIAPSPWTSYDGRNPCGAGFDNRGKTLASFTPYAEFNQPGFTLGEYLNPLVAQNRTYTRYEIRVNEPEYDAIAGDGWSEGRNLPNESHPANLPIGSIAVKAAWRLMTEADTPAVQGALLRRQGRRDRRRRKEPGGRAHRVLQGRHRARRACTSWSRPATGRSGCGARSSMSTTCRRPARG